MDSKELSEEAMRFERVRRARELLEGMQYGKED
jgi:hypothetical protein